MPLNTIDITRAQDINTSDITLQTQYRSYWNQGAYSAAFNIISGNPQLASKVCNNAFLSKIVNGLLTLENYFGNGVTNYLQNLLDELQDNIDAIGYVGTYSTGASYTVGNFVTYNDEIYMCIKTGVYAITDTTAWIELGLEGPQGAVGTGLTYVGEWNNATQYPQYSLVTYDNCLYVSLIANSGANPSTSVTAWQLALESVSKGILTGATEPADIEVGDIWWQYL